MRPSPARFDVDPNIASPQEFSAFLVAKGGKWGDIVKAANILVEYHT